MDKKVIERALLIAKENPETLPWDFNGRPGHAGFEVYSTKGSEPTMIWVVDIEEARAILMETDKIYFELKNI